MFSDDDRVFFDCAGWFPRTVVVAGEQLCVKQPIWHSTPASANPQQHFFSPFLFRTPPRPTLSSPAGGDGSAQERNLNFQGGVGAHAQWAGWRTGCDELCGEGGNHHSVISAQGQWRDPELDTRGSAPVGG